MYSGFLSNGYGSDNFFVGGDGIQKEHCPYSYRPLNQDQQNRFGMSIGEIELCDEKDERVILRVNRVQQTDSNGTKYTLAGWLHLEVELTNKSDQIRMIYAQMYDEYYNAVGEFVTDPTEQCKASDPDLYLSPSPYQYLPCSAIGAREAKPSQAVYMVHRGDIVDESVKTSPVYLPAKELTSVHGVHFTWRMNEYWCSRHYRVTPMIFVLTTNELQKWTITTNDGEWRDGQGGVDKIGRYRMLRKTPKHWLRPIFFGGADIKHPGRSPLECDKPLIDEYNDTITPLDASWILKKLPFKVTYEYYHVGKLYPVVGSIYGANTCQLNPYPFGGNSPAFGGRCKDYTSKDTSSGHLQSCNMNPSAAEFEGVNLTLFEKYGDYVTSLHTGRNASCFNPCRPPNTEGDAEDIAKLNVSKLLNNRTDLSDNGLIHETRTKESIAKFWRGRKFHGVLCIIVSMFLMPVSLFSARYYKETFMYCQCKGAHLWYWIHLSTTITATAVFFSSQTALSQSIDSWGRSQHAFGLIHDFVGWASHMVFILLFIMGGLRGVNMPMRKLLMTAHSVVGFTHYIINLLLIAISTLIPASPSLAECGSDGLPKGFSPILFILGGWVACDVIFHAILNILLCGIDAQFRIQRWYCPIVPMLNPGSHSDLRGKVLRRILFLFYFILSGGFTVGAVLVLMLRPQPEGCVFGELSCKSALGCSPAGVALCKKLLYSNCE
ncbi:unnamed protein product [Orchesella dallaii]